jgi:signal transduction histidine kinase
MARRHLDERSVRDVNVCLGEIKRLDRVVGSLLLVARRGPVDKELLELAPLLGERLEATLALAEPTGVRLRSSGQASVMACREHLIRVMDNLLRNAVEASPPGGLVAICIEQTSAWVRVAVLDDGPGVPDGRTEELFEPFFTLKPEGTGLGLFLSRSLIEAHGGHLRYLRISGQTCFEFSLPREGDHE